MEKAIAFILVLISSQFVSTAQSKNFPTVEYSYAKMYLFNLAETKERPEGKIWNGSSYAKTKHGEGKIIDEVGTKVLSRITGMDMSSLNLGLSKCFIPRHGIVYYDEKDTPVASISICFECEKIALFPNPYTDVDFSDSFSEERALKQLAGFKRLAKVCELPVYEPADKNLYENLLEK